MAISHLHVPVLFFAFCSFTGPWHWAVCSGVDTHVPHTWRHHVTFVGPRFWTTVTCSCDVVRFPDDLLEFTCTTFTTIYGPVRFYQFWFYRYWLNRTFYGYFVHIVTTFVPTFDEFTAFISPFHTLFVGTGLLYRISLSRKDRCGDCCRLSWRSHVACTRLFDSHAFLGKVTVLPTLPFVRCKRSLMRVLRYHCRIPTLLSSFFRWRSPFDIRARYHLCYSTFADSWRYWAAATRPTTPVPLFRSPLRSLRSFHHVVIYPFTHCCSFVTFIVVVILPFSSLFRSRTDSTVLRPHTTLTFPFDWPFRNWFVVWLFHHFRCWVLVHDSVIRHSICSSMTFTYVHFHVHSTRFRLRLPWPSLYEHFDLTLLLFIQFVTSRRHWVHDFNVVCRTITFDHTTSHIHLRTEFRPTFLGVHLPSWFDLRCVVDPFHVWRPRWRCYLFRYDFGYSTFFVSVDLFTLRTHSTDYSVLQHVGGCSIPYDVWFIKVPFTFHSFSFKISQIWSYRCYSC